MQNIRCTCEPKVVLIQNIVHLIRVLQVWTLSWIPCQDQMGSKVITFSNLWGKSYILVRQT